MTVLKGQVLHRFDNGLRLMVDPMPGLQTFSLTALIHGGTRFETSAQSGFAHLLEHMVFKGAGGRNARELAEAIEHRGGSINASTGYEHTRFEVRGLSDLMPLGLEIVSDLMFRPWIDAEELNREIRVVEQEILEAFDTPDDYVFDLLQKVAYPDQALGRPILGTVESLSHATADGLRGFARTLYAPHQVTICLSGGLDPQAVIEAAAGWFADVPAHTGFDAPAQAVFSAGKIAEARKIEQVNLAMAYESVGRLSDDAVAWRLFAEILGGGMASRLFQEAREERGLAYTIDAWNTAYRDAGMFGIFAGCAVKDTSPLIELTHRVMKELAENPTAAELERAKAQSRTALCLNHEGAGSRSSTFASQLSVFGRVLPLDEIVAEIEQVTCDDLSRIGHSLISQAGAQAILGPKAAIRR